MPVLHSGAERYALQPGTYTLGGCSSAAVPLAALERMPEVARIVVPASGESTIQRLTAAVVVRVDRTPIGIEPKELKDGVEIEFTGCRLTWAENAGEGALTSTSTHDAPPFDRWIREVPASAPEPTTPSGRVRIVNMRTGAALDLADGRVVVGRDEGCDLAVAGMEVSRRHCSIAPVHGGYLLRDESSNGTLVNGSRVSGTYLLGHGDIMRIGDEELRYEVEGGAADTKATTAKPTMVLDLSRLRSEHAAAEAHARPGTPVVANLEVMRGPYSGASFSIDRPVCSIGRAAESDVRIPDESVSGNHATLLRKGTSWFVVDLRSANGTFVDGLRVAGERELTSGSRLKLGRVELMFRALDGGVETVIAKRRRRSWLRELLIPLSSRRQRAPSDTDKAS